MALDRGKKEIKLKGFNTEVPHVKVESKFGIAYNAFKPTIERLETEANQTADANYWQTFQKDTSDQLLKFSNEFKNDPNGMDTAVTTYVDNLLEKVPPKYKLQATSMLMSSRSTLVTHASNNKWKNDETTEKFLNSEIWKQNDTNAESAIKVSSEIPDINLARGSINKSTVEHMLIINEKSHDDFENLVNGKMIISNEAHEKKISSAVESLAIANHFRMLTTMNSIDATNYINNLIQGKIPMPIKSDEISEDNPVMVKYNGLFKDDETRKKITDAIWTQYKNWRGKKLSDLGVDNSFKFEAETEIGNGLHFSNFMHGNNKNASKYVTENYGHLKKSDQDVVLKHINSVYKIQLHVADMKNGKIPVGLTNDERNTAFEQLLFEHGIALDPSKIMDVTDMNFLKVKDIFEKQGALPKAWTDYLNTSTGNLEHESAMTAFKKKLEFYNQVSGEFGGWHSNVDTGSFLYHMSTNNAGSLSDAEIIDLAKKWNTKDKKAIETSVETQVNSDVSKFEKNIELALDGNERWWKLMLLPYRESVSRDMSLTSQIFKGKKNKYSDILFEDGFHWFASNPYEDMKSGVKADFIGHVKNELKLMAMDSNVDINNKDVISQATFAALNKLLKADYSPSKFTKKAWKNKKEGMLWDTHDYTLEKFAIENEFNMGDTAITWSVLPTFKAWYESQSEFDIKSGVFGLNQNGEPIKFDDIAAKLKDGDILPLFTPTGVMKNGKMTYSIEIPNGQGGFVKITEPGENFQPNGWENVDQDKSVPSNKANVLKSIANENVSTMEKILGDFKPDDPQWKYLLHKFSDAGEKDLISLANWSWMVDVPLVDDIPNEMKPFRFLFSLLGKNPKDIDKEMEKIAVINKKNWDKKTYSEKINSSTLLNDKSKAIESIYPPYEQKHSEYKAGLMYQHFANENYNNDSLPLGVRTNNLLETKKSEGDNSLNLEGNNGLAVFAHPKDGIKNAVEKMITMSTIVKTGDDKVLEDTPTIEDMIKAFAPNDANLYLKAIKNSPFLKEDMVNFQDVNQLSRIIKFMIKAKMGNMAAPGETGVFDTYYPNSNMMLDVYINEGVNEAYQLFAGSWGKG